MNFAQANRPPWKKLFRFANDAVLRNARLALVNNELQVRRACQATSSKPMFKKTRTTNRS